MYIGGGGSKSRSSGGGGDDDDGSGNRNSNSGGICLISCAMRYSKSYLANVQNTKEIREIAKEEEKPYTKAEQQAQTIEHI